MLTLSTEAILPNEPLRCRDCDPEQNFPNVVLKTDDDDLQCSHRIGASRLPRAEFDSSKVQTPSQLATKGSTEILRRYWWEWIISLVGG